MGGGVNRGTGDVSERRYSEEEVAAVFERATDDRQGTRRQVASGTGMTLAELQEIGREVGIPPEAIAQAASSLDHTGQPSSRKYLGLPIGVGRTFHLGRSLTEAEWERLVVDLRETFDARGSVRSDGSFRQWTNGNLQALLEPTSTGHRLRLRTTKGNARAMMTAGLALLATAAVTFVVGSLFPGMGTDVLERVALIAGTGIALGGLGALRLPDWARRRALQMDGVISRLAASAPAQPGLSVPSEKEPDSRAP
jgi:hypothetical protein